MGKSIRFLTGLFLSLFVFLSVPIVSEASYKDEGNDGSSSKPYIIDSIADLQELQSGVNGGTEPGGKYYKLTKSLNLSPYTTWEPIGWDSSKPFTGHFDGNGNILYVKIERNKRNYSESRAGVFGYLAPGSGYAVKNLTVSGTVEGAVMAPGIAQVLVNGSINNCHFTGNTFGENWYSYYSTSGGIVCLIIGGKITNCTVKKGTIYAWSDSSYDERRPYAGGIAAIMNGGSIENCSVIEGSTIQAYKTDRNLGYAGGIVGFANLNISTTEGIMNCTFSGTINCDTLYDDRIVYGGGIIGSLSGGIVKSCKVLSGSSIHAVTEKNYKTSKFTTVGGIAGELLMGGVVQSCTVETGVTLLAQVANNAINTPSLGGIIGRLDTGTVKSNNFYGSLTGNATYIGGTIGRITGAVTTISGNKYANVEYGIGFDADGFPSNSGCSHVYAPTIKTTSLPAGKTQTAYSKALSASGTKTITWSISAGKLPNGLSLSSDGKITGTPTKTGTFTFTVKAQNAVGYETKELSIKITQNPSVTIKITTATLANSVVGKAYSAQLQATSTPASTLTWSKSAGTLPGGISLSSDGKLTGTPTKAGTFKFTVKAAYSSYSATKELSIIVEPKITIKTASLQDAIEAKSYSVTLSASGASGLKWTKSSGTLPAGLSITSAGKITGTPTKAGTFTFTVKASYSSISYATKKLSITVKPKVSVTTSSLSKGSVGTAYSVTLKATGNPTINWTVTKGSLPTGLVLSKSGQIVGIPEKEGTFSFTVQAKNSYSSASKALKIVIQTGKPAITTSSLSGGTVGEVYNATLKASGTAPFTWTRASGSLPNGLGLSTAGRIIGVPTKAGTFTFTLQVKNSLGTATKKFTIKIAAENASSKSSTLKAAASSESELSDKNVTDTGTNTVKVETGMTIIAERKAESIPDSVLKAISNDECIIAAVLPEVKVSEDNLYLFENVKLDDRVPEGWKLVFNSFPADSGEGSGFVEFFDSEGDTLTVTPSSRLVNVNAELTAGTHYPVITAVRADENSAGENSGSSGGCNSAGINSVMMILSIGLIILRRSKKSA